MNEFPIRRGRRLRQNQVIRSELKENDLNCNDLIAPIFIREGTKNCREKLASLPGINRYSLDRFQNILNCLLKFDIRTIALFPIHQ